MENAPELTPGYVQNKILKAVSVKLLAGARRATLISQYDELDWEKAADFEVPEL